MADGDFNPMRKQDISVYKIVMAALVKHHGSVGATCRAIGIGVGTYRVLMDEGNLMLGTARKIMDGYSRIRQEGAA